MLNVCLAWKMVVAAGVMLIGALADPSFAQTAESAPLKFGLLMEFSGGSTKVLRDRQPQTAAPGLLLRDLQPLAAPDPLGPLGVHMPAVCSQQCRDPVTAVAAMMRQWA